MKDAGRILIMPKGNYDENTEYEMLDLVFSDGASWIAKKNVKGIKPTDETTEHWMRMCSSVDSDAWLSLSNKITELERKVEQLTK